MGAVAVQDGLVTYTGFDPDDNGKRWIKQKGNYTYVFEQTDEWSQAYVPIAEYSKEYLKEARQNRYVMPPWSIEKRIMDGEIAYHFWYGKDYWFFDLDEAIKFIYNKMDEK